MCCSSTATAPSSRSRPDEQVDSIEKIRFMPGCILHLARAGYKLAMVTDQDGLGSESFPQAAFDMPHQFMLDAFIPQGVEFNAVFVCPHRKSDGCDCRKPKTKPGRRVRARPVRRSRGQHHGDRETDLELARNLGVRGLLVRRHEVGARRRSCANSRSAARRSSTTKETDIHVTVNTTAPITIATGIGFFDHMLEQIADAAALARTQVPRAI